MIATIICAVLVVFAADALRSRLRLKLRQRHPATTAPHQLVGGTRSGGWLPLDTSGGANDMRIEDNPFGGIEGLLRTTPGEDGAARAWPMSYPEHPLLLVRRENTAWHGLAARW